jgi:hypothetical protein
MKAAVSEVRGDGSVPTPGEYWATAFPAAKHGPYYFIVDSEEHNANHGNDLDDCDEEAEGGESSCQRADIKWVVLCTHDHGSLGSYCFATDRDPPLLVTRHDADPGYLHFARQPNNDGSSKHGKAPKSMTHHKQ